MQKKNMYADCRAAAGVLLSEVLHRDRPPGKGDVHRVYGTLLARLEGWVPRSKAHRRAPPQSSVDEGELRLKGEDIHADMFDSIY